VPCYPVVGNHDIYSGSWKVWKELIGSTSYRIDGGGATLLFMDSANAFFGADQLAWMEKEAKAAKGRLFVFTHVNLFGESPMDLQQFTDTRERTRIVSLLRGRCDAMFMGHVHRRLIREAGNTQYITTEDYRDHGVYCLVQVSSGGITWEFKKL
jgi:DNA repair exonuclease SbcCD nuclease subunit